MLSPFHEETLVGLKHFFTFKCSLSKTSLFSTALPMHFKISSEVFRVKPASAGSAKGRLLSSGRVFRCKHTGTLGKVVACCGWPQVPVSAATANACVASPGHTESLSVGYFNPRFHSLSNTEGSQPPHKMWKFDTLISYPDLGQLRSGQRSNKSSYWYSG